MRACTAERKGLVPCARSASHGPHRPATLAHVALGPGGRSSWETPHGVRPAQKPAAPLLHLGHRLFGSSVSRTSGP